MTHQGLAEFRRVGVEGQVGQAGPHALIGMQLDGAMEYLSRAIGYLGQGLTADKGVMISSALAIVDNLRASLDRERGGEVAENLGDLYDYMERRLITANLDQDVAALEEVRGLVATLKEGWDGIDGDVAQS